MKGSCLIIVPHQDDETNLVGNIVDRITEEYETFVLYSSIDPDIERGLIRKREAIEACSIWKISKDHLIFLNYPDTPNKAGHHYYTDGDHGIVEDLKRWIIKLCPSIIFATDFDYHSDHRMLSLAFDTAMGQLLAQNPTYHPIVLKGFCYETAYYSVEDYKASCPSNSVSNITPLSNPSFEWEKRIGISSLEKAGPIWTRKAYKALKAHKSQYAVLHARSIVNQDNVFWVRRTDNLLNSAKVKSSADNIEKISDFLILDTDDIITINPRDIDYSKACCVLNEGDWINVTWNETVRIDRIVIHTDVGKKNASNITISIMSDSTEVCSFFKLEPYGRNSVQVFAPITTDNLQFKVTEGFLRISEIEVLYGDIEITFESDTKKTARRYLALDVLDEVGFKFIALITKMNRKLKKIIQG